MKTHFFSKRMMLLLGCILALTPMATVSAETQLDLRGKHQLGFGAGGFFTSYADIDDGFGLLEGFGSGAALSLRYQYWMSDQIALGIQSEVLGMNVFGGGTGALLLGIQYKPTSWEMSSRSFFAMDLGLGGYHREWRGLKPSRTSREDKSEIVFCGFAGLGYHWLMTDHWMLSLNARYHLTGDWTVLTKTGSETMNANGFAYSLGISLLW